MEKQTAFHALQAAAAVQTLQTDSERGLTRREAAARRAQYGKNEIARGKKRGILRLFFSQFADVMVVILLVSAVVSFVVSRLNGENGSVDALIILAIVTVNAVIGTVQESRAEHAIEALRRLSSPRATVVREGKRQVIPSEEVVPGDLVLLSAGDIVPADLRLLSVLDLRTEESSLTGESEPCTKHTAPCEEAAPLAERYCMAYASTGVVAGHGEGIAVATAMDTAVGRVAAMLAGEEAPKTPLQERLAKTGRVLALGVLGICFVIFVMGLLRHNDPLEMLLLSVSLAVAAIPEGLTAVVTIVMALGVSRMAKSRAILRRLPAVETLGSTTVICSDKTGTLTQNRMTVVRLAGAEGTLPPESGAAQELCTLAALCTDCSLENGRLSGDPTETALVRTCGEDLQALGNRCPRVGEIPFTSARKRMTVAVRYGSGLRLICKGAPEVVLARCTQILQGEQLRPLSPELRRRMLGENDAMARDALRVLAVAMKDVPTLPREDEEAESGLVFCGLVAMEDPPRKEVQQAVERCRKAGIRPVMITGDNGATAAAIARKIGLDDSGRVTTGVMLDAMTEEELQACTQTCSVFARVSPEHKVRLVKAFRARGEVVAMTGDGVNDAPALKAADIGCAMGQIGTEVAKSAADMVLTDDNFATIVAAVREGRGIYRNICRTIHFLLSCNMGEILLIFSGYLLGTAVPLSAIQLLWVNLVTDSFPALALGVEPIAGNVMEQAPVKENRSIFSGGAGISMVVEGCFIGALSLLAFTIGRVFFDVDPAFPQTGSTMAFAVLGLSQLVHAYNMRSEDSVFSIGLFSNAKLNLACGFCALLQIAVIAVPSLAGIFRTVVLGPVQWLIVLGLSLLPLLVCEAEKRLQR